MKMEFKVFRPLMVLMLVAAAAGCASSGAKKVPPPSFDSLMSQAEADMTNGLVPQALSRFEEASKADPTRKEPWVRVAQIQFDKADYAHAIVAAEEVLQRDPDDLIADGVLTVSGFRIANLSLLRLQSRGALGSDTARKEAETLATMLKATFGDSILAEEKPKRAATTRRSTTRRSTAPAPSSAPAATPAPSKPASSGDPFKNLGN